MAAKPQRTAKPAPKRKTTAARPKSPGKGDPPAIPKVVEPVAGAFAGRAGVTVGPGWGRDAVVLKRAGKIFAMLVRGEFVAKLPRTRVDQLVEAGTGVRFDPRRDGRVMKEWLVVGAHAARQWPKLAAEAYLFGAPRR